MCAAVFALLLPGVRLQRETKRFKKHQLRIVASAVLFLAGLGAIYVNKERQGKKHLTSWHARVGLAAAGMMLFQGSAASFLMRFNPREFKKQSIVHRMSGRVTTSLAVLASALGAHSTLSFLGKQTAAIPVSVTILGLGAAGLFAPVRTLQRSRKKE
ncbi:MAG: hypothetical protein MHM6MM_007665 [Cercozoa sp. M6MM]